MRKNLRCLVEYEAYSVDNDLGGAKKPCGRPEQVERGCRDPPTLRERKDFDGEGESEFRQNTAG